MYKVEATLAVDIPQRRTAYGQKSKVSQSPVIFFSPKEAIKAEREQKVLDKLKTYRNPDAKETIEDQTNDDNSLGIHF